MQDVGNEASTRGRIMIWLILIAFWAAGFLITRKILTKIREIMFCWGLQITYWKCIKMDFMLPWKFYPLNTMIYDCIVLHVVCATYIHFSSYTKN